MATGRGGAGQGLGGQEEAVEGARSKPVLPLVCPVMGFVAVAAVQSFLKVLQALAKGMRTFTALG